MDGLNLLGAMDGFSKPKKGVVIGAGVGVLVGALLAAFTGGHIGRGFFHQRALLSYHLFPRALVPRVVRVAAGAVAVGAAGAGIGYGVGYGVARHKEKTAGELPAGKPGAKKLPGAK